MIGNAGENVGEPSLWIDIVELSALDQRVKYGGALTAAIRTAEQPRLPAERHRPFILPMSRKSGRFIIGGIPISAVRSVCGG